MIFQIVAEFSRENEKAELTQEAIADSIDDAMMEDESEAEVPMPFTLYLSYIICKIKKNTI